MSSERGSAVVELAIVTPALIAFLMLAAAAGRVGLARNDVYAAAAAGARAASLRGLPAGARADAVTTVRGTLAQRGVTCERLDVDVDTSSLQPGGRVTVDVSCRVGLAGMSSIGLPGAKSVRAQASEVVDRYRSDR